MKKLIQIKDNQDNDLYSNDILEQGTSGGLNYTKYANGMLVYYGKVSLDAVTQANTTSLTEVNLKIPFVGEYTAVAQFNAGTNGFIYRHLYVNTNNKAQLRVSSWNENSPCNAMNVGVFAFGKWK